MIQNTNYGASKSYVDAALSNTYTKAEIDTALALKADQATTYTKTETDTLLGAKANNNAVVHLAGAETIPGVKTFTGVPTILTGSADANNLNLRNDNLTLADQTGGHNTAIAFRGASDALLARFRYRNGRIDNAPARNISLDIYDATGTAHTFELCRLINNTTESWPALDSYAPMVRTTGNTTIYGTKEFINPIKGQMFELASFGSNSTAGWYAICKLPKNARELYIMAYSPGNLNFIMAETNTHVMNVIKWVGNYAPNQNRFMWVETASNMILYIYSATYRTNILTLLNYSVYGTPVALSEIDKSVFTGQPVTKPEVGGDIIAVYDEALLNMVTA